MNTFNGVPEAVWNLYLGGSQVCGKQLKDGNGRELTKNDLMGTSSTLRPSPPQPGDVLPQAAELPRPHHPHVGLEGDHAVAGKEFTFQARRLRGAASSPLARRRAIRR